MNDSPSTTPPLPPRSVAEERPPVVPDHRLLPAPIGQGSYGRVYLAQNVMGTWRAVKVVYRSRFESDYPYEREFAGIRRFEPISHGHPSQVPILHTGRNDAQGYFYYIMELADPVEMLREGEPQSSKVEDGSGPHSGQASLSATHPVCLGPQQRVDPATYIPHTLRHDLKTRGRLPFQQCLDISLSLTLALQHLHQNGLVHGDIKPGNIIFVNGIPKLADIGTVSMVGDQTPQHGGTEGYTPPEGPGSPQADVFSLGRVMYEMMSGLDRTEFPRLPAGFEAWADHDRLLDLNEVVRRAADPDPNARHQTAEALHRDLVLVQAGRAGRQQLILQGRLRAARWVLAVFVVIALAGGVVAWRDYVNRREQRRLNWLRAAEQLRGTGRTAGWSANALAKLRAAAGIRLDEDVRGQAVACFSGLDAALGACTNAGADHVAFDSIGRRLLMDSNEGGKAQLWDLESKQLRRLQSTNSGPVWFDHDGNPRQLTHTQGGAFQLLDPERGVALRDFSMEENPGNGALNPVLVVSSDATFAAAVVSGPADTRGIKEEWVTVWNLASGDRSSAPRVRTNVVCTALAFSPDNQCLALGYADGRVRTCKLPGFEAGATLALRGSEIRCLAFHRDPRPPATATAERAWILAAGAAGGKITIYETGSQSSLAVCRGSAFGVQGVAFSPDGMTLASCGRAPGPARLWDVATGSLLLDLNAPDFAHAVAFSPDGRSVAVGCESGFGAPAFTTVFGLLPSRGLRTLRGLSSTSGKVWFSPDSRWVAALGHDWELGVWDLVADRLTWVFEAPVGLSADNAGVAFSHGGPPILAFATSGKACWWDLNTGLVQGSRPLPRALQQGLCFNGTGDLILFQWDKPQDSLGGTCCVRNLSRTNFLEPIWQSNLFNGRIFEAAVAGNATVVAVAGLNSAPASTNHVVEVHDLMTGKELLQLPSRRTNNSDFLTLDWPGSVLAYQADYTEPCAIWDVASKEVVGHCSFPVHATGRGGLWLATDSRWATDLGVNSGWGLLAASASASPLALGIDLGRTSPPQFSPDSRLLGWGTLDGTVVVCDIAQTLAQLHEQHMK